MEAFSETLRLDQQFLKIYINPAHTFSPHYHEVMEIFIALKNCNYNIAINEKSYTATCGDIIVIDSFYIHSYNLSDYVRSDEDSYLVLIPTNYLKRFNAQRNNLKISNPLIHDDELCKQLVYIIENYMTENLSVPIRRAGTELFLSILYNSLSFSKNNLSDTKTTLARNIIAYIHENFKKHLTREEIAKAFNYTESYISHIFNQYIRISLSQCINNERLAYIEYLKAEGDSRNISELIYEAGFSSLQTYYRVKQKQLNKTLY